MVGMINCVVLERSAFWQTMGLPRPEMDHFQLADADNSMRLYSPE
jgi:hypothetical protein